MLSSGRWVEVRRLLIRVLGRRLVMYLAMLWYMIGSGYRTDLLPIYQAREAYSIFGTMMVRVRYQVI
jgi:hypothetical protein